MITSVPISTVGSLQTSALFTKEPLDGSERFAVNSGSVVKVVRAAMLKDRDLDQNSRLDKYEKETYAYRIGMGYSSLSVLQTA